MIADIGGGSLEIVYLGEDQTTLRDSLPLGAVRLHHLGSGDAGDWDVDLVKDWIASNFEEASVMKTDEVHATGGTVKAIAKTLGRTSFSREDLEGLVERVRREGPPANLRSDRAEVFLPGLLVMRQLLDHVSAATLTYIKVGVGRIFLERFTTRLPPSSDQQRKRYMLQDLRITSIYPRPAQDEGGKQ
jgi:exopolyphosphatase/pppGpp-phosphohydrolase